MKSYQQQIYDPRLKRHQETIIELSKDDSNKKVVEILLNPLTEEELQFANAYLDFLEDAIRINVNAMYDNIYSIDLEYSLAAEYYVKYISAICANKNSEEIKEILAPYKSKDGTCLARILYELQVITLTDEEEFINYLSEKCNVDLEDEKIATHILTSSELIKESLSLERSKDGLTEDFTSFILFAKYYHSLYINGLKDRQNQDVMEMLFILLGDMPESEKITNGRSRNRNIQNK